MKASILIVSLALLIASVSIGGSIGGIIQPLGTLSKNTSTIRSIAELAPQSEESGSIIKPGLLGTLNPSKVRSILEAEEVTEQNEAAEFTPLLYAVTAGSAEQDGAEEGTGPRADFELAPEGRFSGPFLDIMPRVNPGQDDDSSEATFERGIPLVPGGTTQAQPEVVGELPPSTIVYVGGTTIPLSSYQTTFGKYLWIESYNEFGQYASMPQYSLHQYASIPKSRDYYPSLSLIAYTSIGGPGEILEMYPSASSEGIYLRTYYNFNSGGNRIPYRGDVVGRHYLLFTQNDQSSNAVIIDVGNAMGAASPVVLGTAPSTGM